MITRRLNEMKSRAGMTQQQIADRSGIPLGTVSRVFAGYAGQAGFEVVASIVHAMDGHISDLVEEPPPAEPCDAADDPRIPLFYQMILDEKNTRIRNLRRFLWMLFLLLIVTLVAFIVVLLWWSAASHG